MTDADLRGADLRGADLTDADFDPRETGAFNVVALLTTQGPDYPLTLREVKAYEVSYRAGREAEGEQ